MRKPLWLLVLPVLLWPLASIVSGETLPYRVYVPLVAIGGADLAPAPVPTPTMQPPFMAIRVDVALRYAPYVRETIGQQQVAACVLSADEQYALENAVVTLYWARPVVQNGLMEYVTVPLGTQTTGADCWTQVVTIDLRNELTDGEFGHRVWATAIWRELTASAPRQTFHYVP